MAGNPLQKLLPYVKKYGAEIWMSLGFMLFAKMYLNDEKTYKWVYGEFDYQRRNHIDKFRHYLSESENKKNGAASH